MIHLIYSNYTESLLDELAKNIFIDYKINTIWEPINIVVPNLIIKEHLYTQLACRLGAVANLNFRYLDDVIQDLFIRDNYKLLTTKLLQEAILNILSDQDYLNHDILTPVRNYLSNDQTGLKLIQLSSKLANLYDNYAHNCPDLIKSWRKGQHISKQLPTIEAWQQKLWLKAIDILNRAGSRHITIPEMIELPIPTTANPISNIHAFGITHLTQTYHKVFTKLGTLGEFYLYVINPCEEFWEDLIIDDELIGYIINCNNQNKKSTADFNKSTNNTINLDRLVPEGPDALRYWGRTGRDNARLLNKISNYDFKTCFIKPNDETILHKLQKDILSFKEPSEIKSNALDKSIRFFACPSRRREAEMLATEIWKTVEINANNNDPLKFSDIAVILPQTEEASYISHIQAAFQEANEIPYICKNNINSTLKDIIELTELLLDLPISGLTRAAVLRIVAHPAITKRFGAIDVQLWTQWCETLGIIRGANQLDWINTYISQDVLNWDQGLRRLTLGLFMTDSVEFTYGNNTYLPLTVHDPIITGYFLAFIRKLLTDVVQLQNGCQEIRYWLSDFKKYLITWLSNEDESSTQAIEQVFNSFKTFLEPTAQELAEPKLSYSAVKYLAIEAIEKLRNQQFQSLFGGVVISNYSQLHNIPFKAVFLVGLGDGIFPGKDEYNALDLFTMEYSSSNLKQSDNDKYLFLERIISTRKYLCISYVNKDAITGESLEPSCIYNKLLAVANHYSEKDILPIQHPIHRFDPIYFPHLFTKEKVEKVDTTSLYNYTAIAQDEAIALWRKQNTQLQLSNSASSLNIANQTVDLKFSTNIELNHKNTMVGNSTDGTIIISITDLRKWLECPITGAAAIRLGLHKDTWYDKRVVENEVLTNSAMINYNLIRETTLLSNHYVAPEKIYDDAIKKLQAKGQSPFELFEQMQRKENLKLIHAWLALLNGEIPETYRLGPKNLDQNIVKNSLPPLNIKVTIKNQDYQIKLVGDLQPQLWGGSILFEIGKPSKTNLNTAQKKALRAYMDHIILTCVSHTVKEHRAWLLFTGESGNKPEIQSFTFKPISEDKCLEILSNWIQDLFEKDNTVLMPIEAILSANSQNQVTTKTIREYVDTRISNGIGGFSGFYGPVPNLNYYDPPNNIAEIIRYRFSSFLDQIQKFDDKR